MDKLIKSFSEFINEKFEFNNENKWLFDYQVEEKNPDLFEKIDNFVGETIVNWEAGADSEEKGDALQHFGENERYFKHWKINNNGEISVKLSFSEDSNEPVDREDFDYSFGNGESSNFLDALSYGGVSIDFSEVANLPDELAEESKSLF